MEGMELITLSAVVILAAVLAYKSSFLHNKKLGYISLLQVFYLVLAPGLAYSVIFFYILDLLERPLNPQTFLSDRLLTSILLLSLLYTYGGIAIHGITKTLSEYFEQKDKENLLFKVNNHFHRQFSHNLIYSGGLVSFTCSALLELNHVSPYPEPIRWFFIVLNGAFIGIGSTAALSFYKSRWSELKLFFILLWLMISAVIYASRPYVRELRQYPIALSLLIAFSFLAGLNIFLYLRRHKNKLQLVWRIPKKLLD